MRLPGLIPRVLITAVTAALVVGGIVYFGSYLRDPPRVSLPHELSINQVECDPPPGLSREAFLTEVHYYGQLPEKLDARDANLPEKLKAAFAKHPKVERIEKVTIEPPNHVRVEVVWKR